MDAHVATFGCMKLFTSVPRCHSSQRKGRGLLSRKRKEEEVMEGDEEETKRRKIAGSQRERPTSSQGIEVEGGKKLERERER